MYENIKKNPTIKDIEDKAEKALRALSDVDVELNEIIQMCKNLSTQASPKKAQSYNKCFTATLGASSEFLETNDINKK